LSQGIDSAESAELKIRDLGIDFGAEIEEFEPQC